MFAPGELISEYFGSVLLCRRLAGHSGTVRCKQFFRVPVLGILAHLP
jgi:hypothetical protein